jgi:hypothetical protein
MKTELKGRDFDALLRAAEAEPHREGDELVFMVMKGAAIAWAGKSVEEAKRQAQEWSKSTEITMGTRWDRGSLLVSGDDPFKGWNALARYNSIVLRYDGGLVGDTMNPQEALQVVRMLVQAIRHAIPGPEPEGLLGLGPEDADADR